MQRNLVALSVLALLAPLANALTVAPQSPNFSVTSDAVSGNVVVNFSGLTLDGFNFAQISPSLAGFGVGSVTGSLTKVSINATLDASVAYTYADDLTIYVAPEPLGAGGMLQVGGFSSLGATERRFWANGGSDAAGTTVIDTVTLNTPLTFTGTASDPAIWLGNGYGDPNATGTWTGSVTLNFTSAVPEPESWALLLAGGAGLMAWTARRRRATPAANA